MGKSSRGFEGGDMEEKIESGFYDAMTFEEEEEQ